MPLKIGKKLFFFLHFLVFPMAITKNLVRKHPIMVRISCYVGTRCSIKRGLIKFHTIEVMKHAIENG